ADLQREWDNQNFSANMVRALRGEIVFSCASFALMRKSNSETIGVLYGLEKFMPPEELDRPWWERTLRKLPAGERLADFLKDQVYCRIWRFAWLDQDERRYLQNARELVRVMEKATAERSFASVSPDIESLLVKEATKSFYNKLRYPEPSEVAVLSGTIKRTMRAETERSLVVCAIALKRYFNQTRTFPPSLEALVPKFLSSVPADYMNGEPLRYHLEEQGSFVLYSVGENLKDDGGDASMLSHKTHFRNLWERTDVVWPRAALPEEVTVYRAETAND